MRARALHPSEASGCGGTSNASRVIWSARPSSTLAAGRNQWICSKVKPTLLPRQIKGKRVHGEGMANKTALWKQLLACQNFTIHVDQSLTECDVKTLNIKYLFIQGFCGEWFHAMTDLRHLSTLREKLHFPGSQINPSNTYRISWLEMLQRSMTTGLGTKYM